MSNAGSKITKSPEKYNHILRSSPNRGGVIKPLGVVLHHTSGNALGSVDWCMKPESQVSYHVIVEENGTRHQLVGYSVRAWHAGKSYWKGRSDCNSFTIGFAFGKDTNTRLLTQDEVDSFCEWFEEMSNNYGFKLSDLTTHRAVATPAGRKDDVDVRAEQTIVAALRRKGFV